MTDKTIWKFPVELTKRFTLKLPWDFKILKVAKGQIWIEGSFPPVRGSLTTDRLINIVFAIVGTGHSVPKGFQHVGTYFEGMYVWHVYQQWVGTQ